MIFGCITSQSNLSAIITTAPFLRVIPSFFMSITENQKAERRKLWRIGDKVGFIFQPEDNPTIRYYVIGFITRIVDDWESCWVQSDSLTEEYTNVSFDSLAVSVQDREMQQARIRKEEIEESIVKLQKEGKPLEPWMEPWTKRIEKAEGIVRQEIHNGIAYKAKNG
jgi:hypothetical protein